MYQEIDGSYVYVERDLPYTVIVVGYNPQNIEIPALIKHSESEYSPISYKNIQLSTPTCFREYESDKNSELIGDDLESILTIIQPIELAEFAHNQEAAKRNADPDKFKVRVKVDIPSHDYWMYSTAIDPVDHLLRKEQAASLSSTYNLMTKIKNPSDFANQIGIDFAKQIDFDRELEKAQPIVEIPNTAESLWEKVKSRFGYVGEYLICVKHVPVFYIDRELSVSPMRLDSLSIRSIALECDESTLQEMAALIPFIKFSEYKKQREYRFIVWIESYRPKYENFYLKISDELRSLFSPIDI